MKRLILTLALVAPFAAHAELRYMGDSGSDQLLANDDTIERVNATTRRMARATHLMSLRTAAGASVAALGAVKDFDCSAGTVKLVFGTGYAQWPDFQRENPKQVVILPVGDASAGGRQQRRRVSIARLQALISR